MSKHMTIINLACTITKVRKWGEGWKHSAESAHAAFAELHRKHKEAERTIETLRANLTQTESACQAELAVVKDERDQLQVERDALRAQLDTERERHRQTAAVPQSVDAPRAHPVKVGEWLKRTSFDHGPNTRIGAIAKVVGFDADGDYRVSINGTVVCWCPSSCTPCDPPQEASHDTPAGKETAQAAAEPKPGDVVRLVRTPTEDDLPSAVIKYRGLMGYPSAEGETGKVASFKAHVTVDMGDMIPVRGMDGYARWWPLSCIEVVKGGDK